MLQEEASRRRRFSGWTAWAVFAAISTAAVFLGHLGWSEYAHWRVAREAKQAAERRALFEQSSQGLQRNAVRQGLFDPHSAQFRNEQRIDGGYGWCGEVNAKNRLGAYVGFRRYVATVGQGKESAGPWFVRTADNYGADAFEDWWKLNCKP